MNRISSRTLVSDGARMIRPIAPSTAAAADARAHTTRRRSVELREAEQRVAGEQAQRDRRHGQVARQDREPEDAGADERDHAGGEQRQRHADGVPAELPHGERGADRRQQRDRRARRVADERDERARHLVEPALAAEVVGELGRRVQRVQRVAGDGEVGERPDDRRGGERERVAITPAVRQSHQSPRQHPRLGPQEARRGSAARADAVGPRCSASNTPAHTTSARNGASTYPRAA